MKRMLCVFSLALLLGSLPGCNPLIMGAGVAAGWYALPMVKAAKEQRAGTAPAGKETTYGTLPFSVKDHGRIDGNFDYEEFRRKDDGYNITLVNKKPDPLFRFHIVVSGMDFYDNPVYKRRLYVPFIEGKGKVTRFMEGYNNALYRLKVDIYQEP
ncbi:MAG: hypothetical protein JW821_06095 [Deltaproteobacteria bacterium]|nr:hypothetical protein [Deltaproteobacteria bacterium]